VEFKGWLVMWARLLLGVMVLAAAVAPVIVAVVDPSEAAEAGVVLVLIACIMAVVMVAFGSVTLTASSAGVVIRYGRSPFRTVLPLSSITGVDEVDVRWWKWGGIGYRGSRKLFKRAAVVLRSGPAIRFHLDDGSELTVTVDRAREARDHVASLLRSRS
jgi:hypothetical protein